MKFDDQSRPDHQVNELKNRTPSLNNEHNNNFIVMNKGGLPKVKAVHIEESFVRISRIINHPRNRPVVNLSTCELFSPSIELQYYRFRYNKLYESLSSRRTSPQLEIASFKHTLRSRTIFHANVPRFTAAVICEVNFNPRV